MESDKPESELRKLQKNLKSYNTDMLDLVNLISNTYQMSSFENVKKKQKCLKRLLPSEKSKILLTSLNIFNLQTQVKQKEYLSLDWISSIEQIIDESIASENTDVLIFYLNAKGINNKSSLFSDYHDSARNIITSLIEKKFTEFLRRFGFQEVDKWFSIPRSPSIRDRDVFGSLRILNPKVRLINAMNRTKIIKQFFMTDILNNPGKCLNIIFARTFPKVDYIPNNLLENNSIKVYQIYEKKTDSKYHLKNVTKRIYKIMERRKQLIKLKSQHKKTHKSTLS